MPETSFIAPARTHSKSRWQPVIETVLVLVVFALYGGMPIPDSNEPHYLAKAKHAWDPTWCRGDFFLESPDAHQIFYYSFGWLGRWLSLEEMACWGRALTWGLLAFAWRRLSVAIVPRDWFAVLSAALFVMLMDRFHEAGEWVVGGVEAKGFAYFFVLLALEAIVRDRWSRAGWFLGAATSLHVLAGGWAAVAAAITWLASGRHRPPLKSLVPGIVGFVLLALPGLWGAAHVTLAVDRAGIDPNEAHRIYVFERLPHHLSPFQFADGFVGRHILLICSWFLLCSVTPTDVRGRRLRYFVAAAIGIAAVGMAIAIVFRGQPDMAAWFLRFYWFRLSDMMVPIGVALGLSSYILWLRDTRPALARAWLAVAIATSTTFLTWETYVSWSSDRPRADKFTIDYGAWRDVCRWAEHNTPADALFITPRNPGTFHWYANRPEAGTWKDVPQDPRGIVEWWHRMKDFYATGYPPPFAPWRDSLGQAESEQVRKLAQKYHADYVPVAKLPDQPPLDWPTVYENAAYAVYKIDRASPQ